MIIFSIFSLVIIYSGFEAYFRYRFDESDSLGFLKVTSKWNSRHVVFNNYQYRDRDFTVSKKPGVVRIGVMGDSNAFGYGIKDANQRFSNVLEENLKKNGYKVEVYNFGVSGLDTDTEVLEYQRVKQFNFDILVWQYFLNDVEPYNQSTGTKVLQEAQKEPPGIITFLSDNSFFFNYVYWRLSAKYNATYVKIKNSDLAQYNNPPVFNSHKQIIDNFTKDLNADKKKIVVLVIPFIYFIPNYPAVAMDVHKRMDKIFTDDGANVVDLLPYIKGKNKRDLVVGMYDAHPNEYVHALAADKLYGAIYPLLENKNGGTIVKGQ